MEFIAAIGGGAFVLVSSVVGVRLLLVWRRSRELPELVCGLALLLMGTIGYPLIVVVQQATGLSVSTRAALLVVQMLCHVVGDAAICLFTLRVFRPETNWARGILIGSVLLELGGILTQMIEPGVAAFVESGRGIWRLHAGFAIGPLFWAGWESLLYTRRLARRRQIGLADPLMVDRFRMWSIAMVLAASMGGLSVVLEAQGLTTIGVPLASLYIGIAGCAASAAMWLAFVPPPAYVRWVVSRAQ